MACRECPTTVPVITKRLAEHLLSKIPEANRAQILVATFEWLSHRDDYISCYEGINGRPYTDKEKATIDLDTATCMALPCPYVLGHAILATERDDTLGCMLGGLGPHYNQLSEANVGPPYGWLPTIIMRTWDPNMGRELLRRRQIADIKVAWFTRYPVATGREMLIGT